MNNSSTDTRDYKAAWGALAKLSDKYASFDGQASDRTTRTIPADVLMRTLRLDGCKPVSMRVHTTPTGAAGALEIVVEAPPGACLLSLDQVGVLGAGSPGEAVSKLGIPEHAVAGVDPPDSAGLAMVKLREPVLAVVSCPPSILNWVLEIARDEGVKEEGGGGALGSLATYRALLAAEEEAYTPDPNAPQEVPPLLAALRDRVAKALDAAKAATAGVAVGAPLGDITSLTWEKAVRAVAEYLAGVVGKGDYKAMAGAILGVTGGQVWHRMRTRLLDETGHRLADVLVMGASLAGWVIGGKAEDGDIALLGPAPRNGTGPVAAWEDDSQEGGKLAFAVYSEMMARGGVNAAQAAKGWQQETAQVPELRMALAKAAKAAQGVAKPGVPASVVAAAGLPLLEAVGLEQKDPKRAEDLAAALYDVAASTAEAWAPYRLAGELLRSSLRGCTDIATRKAVANGNAVTFAEAVWEEAQARESGVAQGWVAYALLTGKPPSEMSGEVADCWADAVKAACGRV